MCGVAWTELVGVVNRFLRRLFLYQVYKTTLGPWACFLTIQKSSYLLRYTASQLQLHHHCHSHFQQSAELLMVVIELGNHTI